MGRTFTRVQMLDALDAYDEGLPLSAEQKEALKAWDQKQAEIEANFPNQRAFSVACSAYQAKVNERNRWINYLINEPHMGLSDVKREVFERAFPLPDFTRLRGRADD